jgi:hypothetical protein
LRTQFRRALRSGDPVLVLTTAAALEQVQLGEAFAIVLVLADANDARYEKAAARLVSRAVNEADAPLADVSMLAGTLAVLPGGGTRSVVLGGRRRCSRRSAVAARAARSMSGSPLARRGFGTAPADRAREQVTSGGWRRLRRSGHEERAS